MKCRINFCLICLFQHLLASDYQLKSSEFSNPHRKSNFKNVAGNISSDGTCEFDISCHKEKRSSLVLNFKGYRYLVKEDPTNKLEYICDQCRDSLRPLVAFFVGLMDNLGPVQHHADVIFDKVITNEGSIYHEGTGRVTAAVKGIYYFSIVISAQGKEKAAVMLLKNGAMVATVWSESVQYWSSASNTVILNLDKGDQVWIMLLNTASYLHGYMYTTFSGFLIA